MILGAVLILAGCAAMVTAAALLAYERGRNAGRREVLTDWFHAADATAARRAGVALPWLGDAPRADGG